MVQSILDARRSPCYTILLLLMLKGIFLSYYSLMLVFMMNRALDIMIDYMLKTLH